VLSVFALELARQDVSAGNIILLLIVLGVLTGLVQILLGFLGAGRMIKYIPYTVVSGYLTGVGIIIISGQIRNFMGAAVGTSWWQVIVSPAMWDMRSMGIGLAKDVQAWCATNGHHPQLRIVLCGHKGEHDALLSHGWHTRTWTARKGYAMTDEAIQNSKDETLWCSPACVPEAAFGNMDLFNELG
jgi:hypothetical protein